MTSFESLETFLDAVLLWMTPFCAALSIAIMAFFKVVLAPAASVLATAVSIFFISVFISLFMDLFLRVFVSVCLVRLMADLFFLTTDAGKVIPPLNYGFCSL